MANDEKPKPEFPIIYHPSLPLALAIVRAWTDSTYENRLLTFSPGGYNPGDKPSPSQYTKTSNALKEFDIVFQKPVVLTFQEHQMGYDPAHDEILFVLPDQFKFPGATVASAEIAMAATPCGM